MGNNDFLKNPAIYLEKITQQPYISKKEIDSLKKMMKKLSEYNGNYKKLFNRITTISKKAKGKNSGDILNDFHAKFKEKLPIFTLSCECPTQGNKGDGASLSIRAINEEYALKEGKERIETYMQKKGYSMPLSTHAFCPTNQKDKENKLGVIIYYEGDPRL
jgi:hypothetical protein